MLQLITLNIGGTRQNALTTPDPARVVAALCSALPIDPALPTIIAVQESTLTWTNGAAEPQDTAALLAAELGPGYWSAFASEIDSDQHPQRLTWNHPVFRGFRRACEGNALVTNLPQSPWDWDTAQPGQPGHGQHAPVSTHISRATLYSTGDRNTHPRNVLVASLRGPRTPLYVLITHLATLKDEHRHDLSHPGSQAASAERRFQIDGLLNVHAQLRAAEAARGVPPRPILLAGDFNAQPHAPEMAALTPPFTRLLPEGPHTWTHIKHQIAIDHLLVDDPADCLGQPTRCWVEAAPAISESTDHFPVLSTFAD